ncbi:MAG: hydantoinase/oxoprolinase family protein [Salinirussus sp.]
MSEATRLAIDTGGTFTDGVLVHDGSIHTVKTPTTTDLLSGIITAAEDVCEAAGIPVAAVDAVNHGSTIALNTILEQQGPRIGLITTAGFRDVLEIGEGFRDASLLYNPFGDVEDPLVPRKRRLEVPERVDADGAVIEPVDETELDAAIDRLRMADVGAVAVCTLHAYANATNEKLIAARVRDALDGVAVSASNEVSPQIREYHRLCTTVVAAYVTPVISEYLGQLETAFAERGMDGSVNVMNSDGGMARSSIAAERPVTQIISGPVAGVNAARHLGEEIGRADLITFDMGGTSCDTGLIADGEVLEESHREIRGMPVNGPFIDVNTIGAGGGSIAWLDDADALRVGPQSAGADPGPACYGRGGTRPTVTDADAVLGVLNPGNFAGGSLELDLEAAEQSLRQHVADPLDMGLTEAAIAIRDVVDSAMASAVRVVSVKKGNDPRDFSLVGFGGAGPMHACAVATELGIDEVIFPRDPGLLSAFGLTVSDVAHNYVRSVVEQTDDLDIGAVNDIMGELLQTGADELDTENIPSADQRFAVGFEMMYSGQAHQLSVPVVSDLARDQIDDTILDRSRLETVISRFEAEHKRTYDFVDEEGTISVTNVRVTAIGEVDRPRIQTTPRESSIADARIETREVVLDVDESVDVPCYTWDAIPAGEELPGPAIVELSNATIWIPPDVRGQLDERRNLIARRTT